MFNTYYERCNSRDRGRGGAVGDVDMQHASKAQQRAKAYMVSKCRKSELPLNAALLSCCVSRAWRWGLREGFVMTEAIRGGKVAILGSRLSQAARCWLKEEAVRDLVAADLAVERGRRQPYKSKTP